MKSITFANANKALSKNNATPKAQKKAENDNKNNPISMKITRLMNKFDVEEKTRQTLLIRKHLCFRIRLLNFIQFSMFCNIQTIN